MNSLRELLNTAASQPSLEIDSRSIRERARRRRVTVGMTTGAALLGILVVAFTTIPNLARGTDLELRRPITADQGAGDKPPAATPDEPVLRSPVPSTTVEEPGATASADPQPTAGTTRPQATEPQATESTASAPPLAAYDRTVVVPTHQESELPDAAIEGVLVGDPAKEGGCVWLATNADGGAVAVRWPSGYQARFFRTAEGLESFELLNAEGSVMARKGDRVVLGGAHFAERLERCHVGGGSVWYASSVSVQGS